MTATIALVRRPARSLAERCELTFLERMPMAFDALDRQHQAYCDALQAAGAKVLVLDAIEALPDSVFVEDAAVVLDDVAILTLPGAAARQPEPARIASQLASYREQRECILAPGMLEGGDVLRIGNTLFFGLSTRTNRAGIAQLAAIVRRYGYDVVPVEVHGSLHLKTACTALDANTVVLNPAWIDTAAFAGFDRIAVVEDEPFAANVLAIGSTLSSSTPFNSTPFNSTLIANAAFPRTLERVQAHARISGQRIIPVDISEFGKAEAGLTCMSLLFSSLGASDA